MFPRLPLLVSLRTRIRTKGISVLLTLGLVGCTGTPPGPNPPPPPPPPAEGATLSVRAETDGESLDDEYVVRLEGEAIDGRVERQEMVESNGSVDFAGLAQGNYEVSMEDLASNCQFRSGTSSRQARTLTPRSNEVVTFGVSCSARAVGSIGEHDGGEQSGQVAQELSNPVRIRVLDDEGQPYEGVLVDWSASGEGQATPPSSTTGSDGVASARWRLDTRAGQQTLTATVAGQSASVTILATGLPGPMSQLEVDGGDGQSAPVNTLLPQSLRVLALDQYGNSVAGVGIDWDPASGSGSVNPTSGTTSAQGTTTTRWTLGSTVGTQTVTASAGSEEVTFSADATASSGSDVQAPVFTFAGPDPSSVFQCCTLVFEVMDPPLPNGQPGTGVDDDGCGLGIGQTCDDMYGQVIGGPRAGTRFDVMGFSSEFHVDVGSLVDGPYVVRVYVQDRATPPNVATHDFSFTLDGTPPAIVFDSLPSNQSTSASAVAVPVYGTVSDPGAIFDATLSVMVDGSDENGTGADGDCHPLDSGDHEIRNVINDASLDTVVTFGESVSISRPSGGGTVTYCVTYSLEDNTVDAYNGHAGNLDEGSMFFTIQWN